MSGFDNGTSGGIVFFAKQFGSILRGYGPPVPQAGVVGDLYIDNLTFQLFEKRSPDSGGDVDPWGHYIFVVPPLYRTSLKYFGTSAPTNNIGTVGDYYLLWAGYPNYGVQPAVYGPKQWSGWPELGDGPGVVIASNFGATVLPVGLNAEGAVITETGLSQLTAAGLNAEYVIPVPVTDAEGESVVQVGLVSGPTQVFLSINSRYTAEDEYSVP